MLTGAAGYYDLLPFAGLVREGSGIGQATFALKYNLLSESRGSPIGLAVRGHFEVPIRKGIDYLLLHPTTTADLQFGFDGIVSTTIHQKAVLSWNAGYHHINQPVHVSLIELADELPLGFGGSVPLKPRIQFIGEAAAEVFVGEHTPNTTFGAADPIDLTAGLQVELTRQVSLNTGYRRLLNQHAGNRNGVVVSMVVSILSRPRTGPSD